MSDMLRGAAEITRHCRRGKNAIPVLIAAGVPIYKVGGVWYARKSAINASLGDVPVGGITCGADVAQLQSIMTTLRTVNEISNHLLVELERIVPAARGVEDGEDPGVRG